MFLLDANAFIEANRLYYAFDLAPGFWDWLKEPLLEGEVASAEAIKDEIATGSGPLVEWVMALRESFWLKDTVDTVAAMTQLSAWSISPEQKYTQAAVDEFMASADLRLIALAMVSGATVVTRERPAPDSQKRIKIPDVCNAFTVPWTDPFTAYRALGLCLAA